VPKIFPILRKRIGTATLIGIAKGKPLSWQLFSKNFWIASM
jgi:hypothetical protein